jgi:hypothetical protein
MLPYTGHHLAREREAEQEQHGGQLHQNWRKWALLWARLSTLQRAEEDVGKLLISYVPSGMKRISMLVILDFETDSVI